MKLGDLLRETLDVDCDEIWDNERTPTPVRVFGVRLHSMGLSLREVVAVFGWLGVDPTFDTLTELKNMFLS
jgi:putative transposase